MIQQFHITAVNKTKDPIISTDRSVSLNGLKTPVGINGLTDIHCSIVNQY